MSEESIATATKQLIDNHRTLAVATKELEALGEISKTAQGAAMAAHRRFLAAEDAVKTAGDALRAELSKL